MKVLVTGTTGQIARSLVERGAAHPQIELIALGRPHLDLEIAGKAAQAIADVRPDVVINAAAYTAVDQSEVESDRANRINAEGAGEVAAAAEAIGARVIQISTDYVFDGRADRPYTEDQKPNPLGAYGRTKLAGEEAVRSANPDHVIVRTAWVYSPFGHNFVKTMIRAAETRDVLNVVDDQQGSPSSALDLAEGLFRILETWNARRADGLGETYHLAGTGSTTWYGFAQAIMAECRKHGLPAAEVRPIATAGWPTPAMRPANSIMSSAKFARDFGLTLPPWEESLSVVVARLVTEA
jgi:dTDP-4-dehydrorhamnose reductase